MVLTSTGSIAELMPFTSQIINEMKSNVEGLNDTRTEILQNEVKRLANEILKPLGDLYVRNAEGTGSVQIRTLINKWHGSGFNIYFGFDYPVEASNFNFTW